MDPVAAAFEATSRADFLPARERASAAYDGPISIGHGQTNSQPRTVEAMLRLLDVRRGQRVLDVGAGSGWTTALLAHLTGPGGSVEGVELVPSIASQGRKNLAGAHLPWTRIVDATDGVLGHPDSPPYDRILVSAEARHLPDELVAQLADPGRMVIPVRGVMKLVLSDGGTTTSDHGHYRFVPLR